MLEYLLASLFLAHLLISVDGADIFINAMQELFKLDVTISSYYFAFAIVGLIGGAIRRRGK